MVRPNKYKTEEERKKAVVESQLKWRKNHPEKYLENTKNQLEKERQKRLKEAIDKMIQEGKNVKD